MSSKPTTLTSSGHRDARSRQRVQHADRHLVVGRRTPRWPRRGRGQLPADLVAAGRRPVALSSIATRRARRRAWPRRSRRGGPRPRSRSADRSTWSIVAVAEVDRGAGWPARAPSIWSTPTLRPRPDRSPSTTISGTPGSALERTTASASSCGGDHHDRLDRLAAAGGRARRCSVCRVTSPAGSPSWRSIRPPVPLPARSAGCSTGRTARCSVPTIPMMPDRLVTSARAAVLGR